MRRINKLIKPVLIIFVCSAAALLLTRLYAPALPDLNSQVKAQTQTADWPQLQHDAALSGRTTVSVTPEYEAAWIWLDKNHIVKNFVSAVGKSITDTTGTNFTINSLVSGQVQPIIYQGKTYFGSMDGSLYAVNALTGDNLWDFATGGPILGTAAADQNLVITASMDGKIYGLNASTGAKVWEYATGAGINASPIISNSTVYIGSRDGVFYALNLTSGTLKWSYSTRVYPVNAASPFNLAPIVSPAAVSADGSIVFFGAENMFFYALNTQNGTEKWVPKKVTGQSFLLTWPVVIANKVLVYTMSSLPGAEETSTGIEAEVLNTLTAPTIPPVAWSQTTWQQQEKAKTLTYLQKYPDQKILTVFDAATGQEPYTVAMGRVTGNNYPPHMPVETYINSVTSALTYWRSLNSYVFVNQGTFGSRYCPDISYLDPASGDRQAVIFSNSSVGKFSCPELDNGYQPTMGGDWAYLSNHFRGTKVINLKTGSSRGITAAYACRDGACWRGGTGDGIWGSQIIYFGNDADGPNPTSLPHLTTAHASLEGFGGIAIAQTNSQTMIYINEANLPGIVAVRHKP